MWQTLKQCMNPLYMYTRTQFGIHLTQTSVASPNKLFTSKYQCFFCMHNMLLSVNNLPVNCICCNLVLRHLLNKSMYRFTLWRQSVIAVVQALMCESEGQACHSYRMRSTDGLMLAIWDYAMSSLVVPAFWQMWGSPQSVAGLNDYC